MRQRPSYELPANAVVVRLLRERGAVLDPLADETPDDHRARVETALMCLFRDTGSEAAFEALYDFTRGLALSWILAACRGVGMAGEPLDFVQDTYVNVYRYASSFREDHPRSFRGWGRTIASNVVRRARMRCRPAPQGLLELAEPADTRPGPERVASGAEERRSLERAWLIVLLEYAAAYERLSERDRRALDLVEVQGLPYAEVTGVLGVSMSNLKMIMFRSRERIRNAIGAALSSSRTHLREAARVGA
jgi:RNA polymerase sigma-70 factor (ECF subfamily)